LKVPKKQSKLPKYNLLTVHGPLSTRWRGAGKGGAGREREREQEPKHLDKAVGTRPETSDKAVPQFGVSSGRAAAQVPLRYLSSMAEYTISDFQERLGAPVTVENNRDGKF